MPSKQNRAPTPEADARQLCLASVDLAHLAEVIDRLVGHGLVVAAARATADLTLSSDTTTTATAIAAIQANGTAVLLTDAADAVRALKADGVHLSFSPDLQNRFAHARDVLGTDAIIGVAPGESRHSAMECAERGASYVGWAPSGDTATDTALAIERLQWWSSVFEVPCVALTVDAEAEPYAIGAAEFAEIIVPPASEVDDAVRRVLAAADAYDVVRQPTEVS